MRVADAGIPSRRGVGRAILVDHIVVRRRSQPAHRATDLWLGLQLAGALTGASAERRRGFLRAVRVSGWVSKTVQYLHGRASFDLQLHDHHWEESLEFGGKRWSMRHQLDPHPITPLSSLAWWLRIDGRSDPSTLVLADAGGVVTTPPSQPTAAREHQRTLHTSTTPVPNHDQTQ
jgi:hypothetical protein